MKFLCIVSAAKSTSTSVSKTITVLTSPPGSTKASTAQPKTILLVQTVNSRTGIQSLLLPQGLRSLPTTTSDMTFSASRAKMSTLLTVTSSAGKSPLSIVPKMTESLLTSSTCLVGKAAIPHVVQSQVQAQNDIKSIVKLSSAAVPSVLPKVCELTFNSRTIKADGTVCTLKEYLCNFCQYKVESQSEFHEHFMTHVFSCNYCSFRAFTRYEVLSHKKEKHQGIAEELAGYEGLDSFSEQMNSLIADFHCQTPVSTQMLVVSTQVSSAGESTTTTDSESASMVIVSSRPSTTTSSCVPPVRAFSSASPIAVPSCLLSSPTSLVSVSRSVTLSAPVLQTSQPVVTTVSTPIVSAAFVAQKKTPVVTSATPSPAILPVSTVKTTASVGKANDNYFTYKIVHDAAGKVQAYECDVCSYRSTKINEIFGHASTHSLTDLMKSNNVNVQWECFYCCFTSVLQANVVSHVIAKHPNKPIQLKRMVTNTTQRSTSRSVLLRSTNFPTDAGSVTKATPSPPIKKEKTPEETPTSAAAAAAGKKPDEADDGCMWGCYYCSVQSVDRNEIILHLKKDHAQQKLVITRRRITHIPAPHASKIDGNPEAAEISSDLLPNDSEVVPSDRTNSDVQIGDIDSTDPQHSLLKSRRKQVFPRKVFDDATNDEAGESSKVTEVTETTALANKSKRRFPNSTKSKEFPEQTDSKQVDGTTSKKQRKIDESAKRMKHNDSMGKDATNVMDMMLEENGADDDASTATIIIDGQDGVEDTGMPALEDVSNFIRLKSAHGKVSTPQISLANEPMGQVAVTSCPVNEVTPEPDKEMPVLHPELTVPVQADGKFSNQQGPGIGGKEKDNVALEDMNFARDWPDDISLNDSKLFRFDKTTLEAHCNCCNLTTQGLNARNHMREHVMTHTGGHLWTCPYCPFKCGRRSMIFRHVQNKHKSRPLRLIQRKVYTKSSEDGTAAGFHSGSSDSSKTELSSVVFQGRLREHSVLTKLKGPRTVKERSIIRTSTNMWQCPFCGRRNVFKGALKIHLKVAHPNQDCNTKLKRLIRPCENQTKKPICAEGVVDIVPIEDMHLYETLSTLLLDNGTSLIHDLDIDDEVDDVEDTTAVNRNTGPQKYRCIYCHFRNSNPRTVKSHVLQMHPGELVMINDHRGSRRTYHLFMCRNPECSFYTNKQELLTAHCCKVLGQETDKAKVPSNPDEKLQSIAEPQPSSDMLARPKSQSKSQANLDSDSLLSQSEPPKSVDITPGSETRQETSYAAGNLRKRLKTPEGPIDYNDDGTLKGVELEHGSMVLQCRYCDYPKTSDPVEIKDHLASKHPRLKPIAIDVDAKEKGGLACLFVCSVFGCEYSSHYSNVFEHHMNLEHPDVESNRLVKKKRTHKRTSTDKARIQNDLSNLSDKNEPDMCKEAATEETSAVRASSKSSDDKDILPTVPLSSPATSTFSQPALSPVGTVASDVSNAFGDSPAIGSPDDLPSADVSLKETRLPKKPRSKPRESFDYPVRFECVQCSFRIGSLEEMKSHLVAKHRDNFRNFYCIDRRARELRKRQKVLFCRDEQCSFYCKFDDELESHEKYSCTFGAGMRHHQKTTQEGVLQYMESVVKVNPSGVTNDGTKVYQVSSSRGAMVEDVNNKMYQCSHCTFITTDLHNIRMHVIAEHAATEGGFAEIKTELGTDGNIVMNVNDRGVRELGSKSALNIGCDKNVIRESRSMYDAVDTVKIDDEEKVYTVL